jgi:hypothetical protein
MTETVWRRADDVLTRGTSRSVVVLTADANDPVVLEGAAVAVWNALEQPATAAQLVTAIATRLALADDDVRSDVAAARELLHRHGVLVGSPALLVGSDD